MKSIGGETSNEFSSRFESLQSPHCVDEAKRNVLKDENVSPEVLAEPVFEIWDRLHTQTGSWISISLSRFHVRYDLRVQGSRQDAYGYIDRKWHHILEFSRGRNCKIVNSLLRLNRNRVCRLQTETCASAAASTGRRKEATTDGSVQTNSPWATAAIATFPTRCQKKTRMLLLSDRLRDPLVSRA